MRARGDRGFSVVEMVVALGLLAVALTVIYELILGAMRISMFAEAKNDLTAAGQRVVNAIQTEVIQAKLLLEENTVGAGYRALFTSALPAGVSVWTNSRLPIIDQNISVVGPDPGPDGIAYRTGNSLIVVRQLAPVAVPWDHDANAATPDTTFLVDRYEFQYYFLRSNPARNFGGFGYYLEVMKARSQIFADCFELNGITTNRAQVAARLRSSAGITMAWNPGSAVADPAFYDISTAGALSGNSSPTFTVAVSSLVSEFLGGRVSGKMEYSVGLNADTPLPIQDSIPLYATSNANFPGGLEFQVVGPSGFRKVMTRLVLVSWYDRRFSSTETSVITSVPGF